MGCGLTSIEEALKRLEPFKLQDVVQKIECPCLIVHGANDAQISLEEARRCFEAIGSRDKTLRVFTAEEGGQEHCQIDCFGIALPYMHDWLAAKLK